MILKKSSTRLWTFNNKKYIGKTSNPVNVETLKLYPAEISKLANLQLTKSSSDPRISCSSKHFLFTVTSISARSCTYC